MSGSLLLSTYTLCCLVAVTAMLLVLRRSFYTTHKHWRDAPRAFAEACAEAVFMGLILGVGIGLALLSILTIFKALTG